MKNLVKGELKHKDDGAHLQSKPNGILQNCNAALT